MVPYRLRVTLDQSAVACGDDLTGEVKFVGGEFHPKDDQGDLIITLNGVSIQPGSDKTIFLFQNFTIPISEPCKVVPFKMTLPETFLPPSCDIAGKMKIHYFVEAFIPRSGLMARNFRSTKSVKVLGLCPPRHDVVSTDRTEVRHFVLGPSLTRVAFTFSYPFGNGLATGGPMKVGMHIACLGDKFPSGFWTSRVRIILQKEFGCGEKNQNSLWHNVDTDLVANDTPIDLECKSQMDYSHLVKDLALPCSAVASFKTDTIACEYRLFASVTVHWEDQRYLCFVRAPLVIMGSRDEFESDDQRTSTGPPSTLFSSIASNSGSALPPQYANS